MATSAATQLMEIAATSNSARQDLIKGGTAPRLLDLLGSESATLSALAAGTIGNLLDGACVHCHRHCH